VLFGDPRGDRQDDGSGQVPTGRLKFTNSFQRHPSILVVPSPGSTERARLVHCGDPPANHLHSAPARLDNSPTVVARPGTALEGRSTGRVISLWRGRASGPSWQVSGFSFLHRAARPTPSKNFARRIDLSGSEKFLGTPTASPHLAARLARISSTSPSRSTVRKPNGSARSFYNCCEMEKAGMAS
jgi:hypothetical protein